MALIRPIKQEDAEALHELVKKNKSRLCDYFPKSVLAAESVAKAAELIDGYIKKSTENQMYVFVIPGENGISGVLFIKDILDHHRKCEIAYFIDKDLEGKGLISKGVHELLFHCFEILDINKVICRTATDNAGSIRVAEKNGFSGEGILKKDFRVSGGEYVDIIIFGLLREDYREMNSKSI